MGDEAVILVCFQIVTLAFFSAFHVIVIWLMALSAFVQLLQEMWKQQAYRRQLICTACGTLLSDERWFVCPSSTDA